MSSSVNGKLVNAVVEAIKAAAELKELNGDEISSASLVGQISITATRILDEFTAKGGKDIKDLGGAR